MNPRSTIRLAQCVLLSTLMAMTGCMSNSDTGSSTAGSGGQLSSSGNPNESGSPSPSPVNNLTTAQAAPAGLGCGWQIASDPDRANIAFPDTYAKYWVAGVMLTPGTRVRIDGQYPDARYFSYNAYDAAIRPTDAIADYQISPKGPGINPFTVKNGKPGGHYTAYLEFGKSPTQDPSVARAPNTFYSGDINAGPAALPNGAVMVPIIYRIYISHAGQFFNGGVPLPTLTLETADGKTEIGTLPTCEEPLLPTLGGNAPNLGLNEKLISADYPDAVPTYFPVGTNPPATRKFFSLPDVAVQIARGMNSNVPDSPDMAPFNGGGGFLSNVHNQYVSVSFNRRYGNIAVVRGKAPSFRDEKGIGFGQEQMRYWSICGNEFATQRFTACSADYNTVTDANGYFTVVVSDAADRPANATEANGITWIPWGAYPDMVVIYRQMLADPDFAQSIANQPFEGDLKAGMGPYYPAGTYCDKTTVEQSNNPAQMFALCQQYEHNSIPVPVLN